MVSSWRRDCIDRAHIAVLYIVRLHVRIYDRLPTDLATAPLVRQAQRAFVVRRWQQAFAQYFAMKASRRSTLLASVQQKPRKRAARC
jgi:hypothetical protein